MIVSAKSLATSSGRERRLHCADAIDDDRLLLNVRNAKRHVVGAATARVDERDIMHAAYARQLETTGHDRCVDDFTGDEAFNVCAKLSAVFSRRHRCITLIGASHEPL